MCRAKRDRGRVGTVTRGHGVDSNVPGGGWRGSGAGFQVPAADGRTAGDRKADAPVAGTCHPKMIETRCSYVVTRSRPYLGSGGLV